MSWKICLIWQEHDSWSRRYQKSQIDQKIFFSAFQLHSNSVLLMCPWWETMCQKWQIGKNSFVRPCKKSMLPQQESDVLCLCQFTFLMDSKMESSIWSVRYPNTTKIHTDPIVFADLLMTSNIALFAYLAAWTGLIKPNHVLLGSNHVHWKFVSLHLHPHLGLL